MLSSQTKDEVTDAAVDKLRAALGGTLSLEALLAAEEQVIADAISKVGFWRRKTQFVPTPPSHPPRIDDRQRNVKPRYIRQAAQRLQGEFDSDVPKTVDELCSLPGVGPKMAFLCLHAAWDMWVLSCSESSCDRTRVDDNLGQKCGHWRGRSCAPYHQQAQVAQTTYKNSRGDKVRE